MPHLSPLPWLIGSLMIWMSVIFISPSLPYQTWVTIPANECLIDPLQYPWYDIWHLFLLRPSTIPNK